MEMVTTQSELGSGLPVDTSVNNDVDPILVQEVRGDDETATTKLVKAIKSEWQSLLENNSKEELQPRFRGKVLCLFYLPILGEYFKYQPLLTIGPHYKYSISLIIFVDLLAYFSQSEIPDNQTTARSAFFCLLALQNLTFLMTVLSNPGLANRDASIHRQDYLDNISANDLLYKVCKKCRIIKPEDNHNVYHCRACNTCVINHDHHCEWSSKCIAGGNIVQFYMFLVFTGLTFASFVVVHLIFKIVLVRLFDGIKNEINVTDIVDDGN